MAYSIEAGCQGLPRLPFPDIGCNSDATYLYHDRGLDQKRIPYVQEFNEYPPLTATLQYLESLPVHSSQGFFLLNTLVMAILALAMTWVVYVALDGSPRTWIWALGPPLWLYAAHNWDLLPVLLATAGLWMHSRKREGWAGALLGLAVAAKWYPALFGLVVFTDLLRSERRFGPRTRLFALAATAGALLPHLPYLFVAPRGVIEAYAFHLGRTPTEESLVFVLERISEAPSWVANLLGAAGVLAVVVVAIRRVWSGAIGFLPAALAVLAAAMMGNKVYSLQYAIWLLPLLALVRLPWPPLALFFAADLVVHHYLYEHFHAPTDAAFLAWTAAFAVARAVGLGWMVACALRPSDRTRPGASPSGAGTPSG
ncbi:MAG: glycosyltransferase 87 family protein [Thermoplasmatota archaeon]